MLNNVNQTKQRFFVTADVARADLNTITIFRYFNEVYCSFFVDDNVFRIHEIRYLYLLVSVQHLCSSKRVVCYQLQLVLFN